MGAGTGIEPGPVVQQADALPSELRPCLIMSSFVFYLNFFILHFMPGAKDPTAQGAG
jgi:hypothetical protein